MYEFTITGSHVLMAGAGLVGFTFVFLLFLSRAKRKEREATLEEFIQKVETGLNILGSWDRNGARYDAINDLKKFMKSWYDEQHQPQPDAPTEVKRPLPNNARQMNAVFINQNDPPYEAWFAEADLIITPQSIIKNRHGETGRIVPQNERLARCPNCCHDNKYKCDASELGWSGIICTDCGLQFSHHHAPGNLKSRCGHHCSRCQTQVTIVSGDHNGGALVCSNCHPLLFERYAKLLKKDEIPKELFDRYLANMPLVRQGIDDVRVGGMLVEVGTKVLWGDIEGEILDLHALDGKHVIIKRGDNGGQVCIKPSELRL